MIYKISVSLIKLPCFFKEHNRLLIFEKNIYYYYFFSQHIMQKRSRLEKDEKIEDNIIKDVKNLFRLKKENEAIKDRIIRDIRNLFQHEEEDYYKPVRVFNF